MTDSVRRYICPYHLQSDQAPLIREIWNFFQKVQICTCEHVIEGRLYDETDEGAILVD